jgi:hypothetical protein
VGVDELLMVEEATGAVGALGSMSIGLSSKVLPHLQHKTMVWFTGSNGNKEE